MKKLNIFKNIFLIIGITITALSIAYYFVIYLPSDRREKELYRRREDCVRIGRQFHSDRVKNPPRFAESELHWYLEPRFYYNPKITKCLYNSGFMVIHEDDSHSFEEWIIDINTSEYLARLLEHTGENGTENVGIIESTGERCKACMNKEEFNLEKQVLFED